MGDEKRVKEYEKRKTLHYWEYALTKRLHLLGLEPRIARSVGERLIHWAIGALRTSIDSVVLYFAMQVIMSDLAHQQSNIVAYASYNTGENTIPTTIESHTPSQA